MTLSGPSACSQKAGGGQLLFTQDTSLFQCRGHGRKAEDNGMRSPITALWSSPSMSGRHPGQPYSGMNWLTDGTKIRERKVLETIHVGWQHRMS